MSSLPIAYGMQDMTDIMKFLPLIYVSNFLLAIFRASKHFTLQCINPFGKDLNSLLILRTKQSRKTLCVGFQQQKIQSETSIRLYSHSVQEKVTFLILMQKAYGVSPRCVVFSYFVFVFFWIDGFVYDNILCAICIYVYCTHYYTMFHLSHF